jgi:hypothetical protein
VEVLSLKRRELMLVSGAALVAGQGLAKTLKPGPTGVVSQRRTQKLLLKYSKAKSFLKVPKSAKKTTKYVNSLTALVGLSANQQTQATTALTAARETLVTVRTNLKAAKKLLATAVKNNDSGAMGQASTSIGNLMAQKLSTATSANAALYQMLTPDQQSKLSQFQG